MCGLCSGTRWIHGRVESVTYEPADPWGMTTSDIACAEWCEGRVPCPACVPSAHGRVVKIEIRAK